MLHIISILGPPVAFWPVRLVPALLTSTIRAVASPRQPLLCSSMRCVIERTLGTSDPVIETVVSLILIERRTAPIDSRFSWRRNPA